MEERGEKEKGRCPFHTNFFFVEGVKRQKALSKSLIVRMEREIDIKGGRERERERVGRGREALEEVCSIERLSIKRHSGACKQQLLLQEKIYPHRFGPSLSFCFIPSSLSRLFSFCGLYYSGFVSTSLSGLILTLFVVFFTLSLVLPLFMSSSLLSLYLFAFLSVFFSFLAAVFVTLSVFLLLIPFSSSLFLISLSTFGATCSRPPPPPLLESSLSHILVSFAAMLTKTRSKHLSVCQLS